MTTATVEFEPVKAVVELGRSELMHALVDSLRAEQRQRDDLLARMNADVVKGNAMLLAAGLEPIDLPSQ